MWLGTRCNADACVDDAWEAFRKRVKLGDSPLDDARDPDLPVGLYVRDPLRAHDQSLTCVQNLGATCYANASLQVRHYSLIPLPEYSLTLGVVS